MKQLHHEKLLIREHKVQLLEDQSSLSLLFKSWRAACESRDCLTSVCLWKQLQSCATSLPLKREPLLHLQDPDQTLKSSAQEQKH